MRDEKEERKKQARSNKQTRQSNTCTCMHACALRYLQHCFTLGIDYFSVLFIFFTCRGETFRAAFSLVGEVCSLIPKTVSVMALTATATRKAVCRKLGTADPMIVCNVPNRPNIRYSVVQTPGIIEEAFVEQLCYKRTLHDYYLLPHIQNMLPLPEVKTWGRYN